MATSTSPSAPTECYTSSACSTDYLTALETGWRRRSHFVVCVAPKPGRPQKNDDLPHLRLTYRRIGEAYYRIDSPVRTKRNDACSGHPLFPVAARRNPIGEHSALAMPDVSLSSQTDARHKPVRRTNVSCQIGYAVEQAEAVAEGDSRGDDLGERFLACFVVRDYPGTEPRIHRTLRVSVRFVCHCVGEQRELEAPALHVFIAHIGFGEFMLQMQLRSGFVRLQTNRYARGSGRHRLAAHETVGEYDPLGLTYFQHFAQSFDAVRVTDVHLSTRLGIDGGARAPPASPSRTIGEESKNGLRPCFDHNRSVQVVWQFRHSSSQLSFLVTTSLQFGSTSRFFQLSGQFELP